VEPQTSKTPLLSMRFDISSKLALVLLVWVCAFTLDWFVNVPLLIVAVGARYLVPAFRPQSARATKAFDKFLLYSVAILVLLTALNAVLMPGGEVLLTLAGVNFHYEGLMFGIKTAARLLLLSVAILVFFISTPLPEFVRFLQQKGLPAQLVLILLLTLHFLDQLPGRINRVFVAQEARGAPVRAGLLSRAKSLTSILSPLVLSSIVESIERGTALEVRGFLVHQAQSPPTLQAPTKSNPATLLLLVLALAVFIFFLLRWLLAFS
jgi:energy-coupling factor transport system permease protein